MKIYLALLVSFFAFGFSSVIKAEETNISISIAVPMNGAQRLIYRNQLYDRIKPHFHVVVSNISNRDQKIYGDGNSYGYDALSFEITDETGKCWTVKKKPITIWVSDAETFWTLKPKDLLVLDVDFTNTNRWIGFPANFNLNKPVTMRAIFEIKGFSTKSVWNGRSESKSEQYVFYNSDSSSSAK